MEQETAISIKVETPLSEDMREMIAELSTLLLSLSSEEACHHLTAEQMANEQTTVFVARANGKVAACGALHRHQNKVAEVKRMYTRPGFQGLGLGRKVLTEVIHLAEKEGFAELVLETGVNFKPARNLYESAGFKKCGPVLDYPEHPESVFYSRPVTA